MLGCSAMIRAAAVAFVALVAAGCQTYDFEPVVPLAVGQTTQNFHQVVTGKKPNIMLLVDKSGSMKSPINPANPNCPSGCGSGTSCPANCPTRIGDLRNAMSSFLTQSATDARFGLTFFPTDLRCAGPTKSDVDIPAPTAGDEGTDATLSANSASINQKIQAIDPAGGTPTAASLAFVGSLPGLNDQNDLRPDYILLLTDGLPNCNTGNPNQMCTCDAAVCGSCPSTTACGTQVNNCKCTLSSCQTDCAVGCLDTQAVVDATIANARRTITTIVVGFGADTAVGDAPDVLNAIAKAGTFPRDCLTTHTDADCGTGNTCDVASGLCTKAFYQATDANELSQTLRDIINKIKEPCKFKLDTLPPRPEYIAVIVNGVNVPSGPDTWQLTAGQVVFEDTTAICQQIKASTAANPVDVQIRVIETF